MHREYRTVEGLLVGNEMGNHGVVDDKRIPVKIIKTYQETPDSCYYKIEIHGEQIKQHVQMEAPYFATLPTEFKNPVVYKYQSKYHIAVEAVVMRDDDEEDLSDTYWHIIGCQEVRNEEDNTVAGFYLSNGKFVKDYKAEGQHEDYLRFREQYERNKRLEEQGKSLPLRGFMTMNAETLMKEYIEPEKKLEVATAAVSILSKKDDEGNCLPEYIGNCILITDNKETSNWLSNNYKVFYKERHDKDFEKMYKQFYNKEYQNCGFCGAKNPIVKGRSLVYCVYCHSKLEWYRNKCMDLARYDASFNKEQKHLSISNLMSGFNIHTEYGEGAYDEEDT